MCDRQPTPTPDLEALYRSDYRRYLRVALGFLGDIDTAHDAVQEAFARALRSSSAFRQDASLATWVWRTLVNLCLDWQRRDARKPIPERPEPASESVPAPDAALSAAIAGLPPRQRAVVFLRHYADLDYVAIAAVLGISRGTVAATLYAAHEGLRRTLTAEVTS